MKRPRFARPVREKSIEAKCRLYAESQRALLLKTEIPGRPGFPDRMLIRFEQPAVFIEFKRPGGRTTDLQTAWHKMLADMGQDVHVIYDFETFKSVCDVVAVR